MASSIDAIPTKTLESLLECSVCLETLNDPRTLHCFHSFCRCCLEKFVQGCRDKNEDPQLNKFECPYCRSEFKLSAQGVEGIGANYFVRNMLDIMAVESRVKGIPCHYCQKASAGRCVHSKCECFLCEGCIQAHNNYLGNQNHSVLLMDELSKPENRSKIRRNPCCKEHEGEILKFFCETCEELICRDCKDDNHEDHKCSPLKKAAEQKSDELKKWCATLSEELNGGNEALQAMNNVVQVLDNNVKAAKNKIRKRKNNILAAVGRMLEEKEKSLTDKIDEIHRVKSETINKQLGESQVYVNKVRNSMNICKSVLENGDAVEIVSSHRMVVKNIEKAKRDHPGDWKPVNDGSIPFKQSSTDAMDVEMSKLSERLGEIKGFVFFPHAAKGGLVYDKVKKMSTANTSPRTSTTSSTTVPTSASPQQPPSPTLSSGQQDNPAITMSTAYGQTQQGMKSRNGQHVNDGPEAFTNPITTFPLSTRSMPVHIGQNSKDSQTTQGKTSNNDCPICQSAITNPKVLPRCGHTFCTQCIDKAFTHQKKCPICQEVYGITEGNQPHGTMNVTRSYDGSLPGYEGCGYHTITYNIRTGKQDSRHPNPGSWFTGTTRHAYLPASKEGEVVLKLLQKAFEKKLIFTVGRSTTTGTEDCVTWNDIHHKTSMRGGPQRFGYPDPDYLGRVTDELKAKGIVPE